MPMEEEISEIEKKGTRFRFRIKEQAFVPFLALLIAGWAYTLNSPSLALISVFTILYSIIRHIAYRARQRHRFGSYEEDLKEEESAGRWDVAGGIWVIIVIIMLVALSINSRNRYVQPGTTQYHLYKDCVMLNKHKEVKQYSYDADIFILQLKPCQECRVRKLQAQRAWQDIYKTELRTKRYKNDNLILLNEGKEDDQEDNFDDDEEGYEDEDIMIEEMEDEI